jgi:uncharacterized protein YkwD
MQSVLTSCRKRHMLAFAFLAVLTLTGAQCGNNVDNSQASGVVDPSTKTIVPGSGVTLTTSDQFAPNSTTEEVWTLINNHRTSQGLSLLMWDQIVAGCSQDHTDRMVNSNFFALVTPSGMDVFTRLISSLPPSNATQAQYFILQGTQDPNALFDFLLHNSSFHDIMDDSTWRNIGIGYNSGNGGTWTITFTN